MDFPQALLELRSGTRTVQEVIDQLAPLGLPWRVEEETGRRRALAPLYVDSATREIWALATVENWGSPRHEHNAGGLYGELVITLAGALADETDDGVPVLCVPGTALYHAGGTIHEPQGEFWAGIYHQPRGSTPRPE
jgi:hypothetical protein